MNTRIRFTPPEITFIKRNYTMMSDKELSLEIEKKFGVFHPHMSIRCVRERKGWKKMALRAAAPLDERVGTLGSTTIHRCV